MAEWKLIKDFPNYEVSDDGRVRSLGKGSRWGTRTEWLRELKPFPDKDGYLTLGLSRDGKRKTFKVHSLVADAFVGGKEPGLQVNHMHPDGDKTRNLATNLEWISCKKNIEHADAVLQRRPKGERSGKAKLTEVQVLEIRASPLSACEIAPLYGVRPGAIWFIRQRKNWAHI